MLYFAPDYRGARARFLDLARGAGAALTAHMHPTARGPGGEPLSVDVARIGPAEARKVLFVLSGTHGIEGFCGSAVQCAWLEQGGRQAALPADIAVVMVHAINPWGFAHESRTTENNVDLNRNFIDHSQPPPPNPGYEELHPFLCPSEWSEATLRAAETAINDFVARHGRFALSDALRRGQYTRPDGLFYGGDRREWSNLALERIVAEHLVGAEKIGFLEWHTGLGDYAEDFFICFSPPGSPEFERACRWWGRAKIDRAKAFDGEERPNYQGLLVDGVRGWLGGRPLAGAVVEFGTQRGGGPIVKIGLRADRWLKFACRDRGSELARRLERERMEAFCPTDEAWRRTVIDASRRIHDEALAGLAAW